MRIEPADPGDTVIHGWNQVLNRALPWFASPREDQQCFPAELRFTATIDDAVVGIAERSPGGSQLLVAVDPAHRGQGIGRELARLVDSSRSSPVSVFCHDPSDPAAAALATEHGLAPEGGEPLVLWSLDADSAAQPGAGDVEVGGWREETPSDLAELREAVRWWATDNTLDESHIRDWQAGLPGDLITTVARSRDRHIVGVGWAEPLPFTDLWRATHLSVAPGHRGRRLGLALTLARAELARRSGVRGLVTQIGGRSRANAIWAAAGGTRRDLTSLVR